MYEMKAEKVENPQYTETPKTLETEGNVQKKQLDNRDVRYKIRNDSAVQMQKEKNPVVQKVLRPILQTGPNCGLFALAMALEDLTGEKGEMIASEMEEWGRARGYTAMGEMFNSENLVKTGQEFCNHFFPDANIHMKIVNFETQEEMKEIFNLAKEKEKYLLFPYYANRAAPFTGYSVVPKENMETAHWAVVERRKKEGETEEQLHILEGHSKIFDGPENSYLNPDRMQQLFKSHMSLNNELVWTNYWNKYSLSIRRMREQMKHAANLIDKVVQRGTHAENRLIGIESEEKELEIQRREIKKDEQELKRYLDELEAKKLEFRQNEQMLIYSKMQNYMLESPYYEAYMEQLEAAGPFYEVYIHQMTVSKHYYEEYKRELELARLECQEYKKKIDKLKSSIKEQKKMFDKKSTMLDSQKMEQLQWREKVIRYHQELTDEKNRIEELIAKTETTWPRFFNSPRILNRHPDLLDRGEGTAVHERVNLRNRMILVEKKS